jgi:hypothetical protein
VPLILKNVDVKFHARKLDRAADFLTRSNTLSVPANTIIFIDSHSDTNTGYLQYAGGVSKALVLDLKQVSQLTYTTDMKKLLTILTSSLTAFSDPTFERPCL